MSKKDPLLLTRYAYEKRWVPVDKDEALRIIAKEMPQTDPEGTFAYILSATQKGKVVTLGECLFKVLND